MNDEGLVTQYLNQFITATSATKAALQRDITRRGGDQGQPVNGAASSGPARPQNRAEFDALPSGATFIAPDGTTRRKP
jgi:hypothetical protein